MLHHKWYYEKNIRNKSAGGTPSEGEVGTPVSIHLRESPTDKGIIEGESRLGQVVETWQIKENTYVWKDDVIEVTSKSVAYGEIPAWIKDDLKLKASDRIYAFKFEKCSVIKTQESCTPNIHFPEGLDKTGHWIFKTQANQLNSNVVYKYADGNKRILTEALIKE